MKHLLLTHMTKKKFPGVNNKFSFQPITVKKMVDTFNSIKSNAMGSDDVNLRMLLLVIPYLGDHLTYIINKCLSTGTFPNVWKEVYVIPVPKTSNPSSTSNFHPISILPTISEILEKIVYEQLAAFLDSNNVLPVAQSGFRRGYSTTTALLHVTDELCRAVNNQNNAFLVLLDYRKAFYTLDHAVLCTKLKYFGLVEVVVQFFSNYLGKRRQRVVIDGVRSDKIDVNKGVPQGSVLGPLLFPFTLRIFLNF